MPNRLAHETSPYLRQHRDNPVDWYPWGPEALERARREDKPIFLSIGYAACHWCHVMEHESFENHAIAKVLNEHFVSIKVDREERPELDQIYMQALQGYHRMIGSPQGGGWPLSMFLTPDLEPFLGGTYWPPESRWGRPGFADVLEHVARLWREKREDVAQQGRLLTRFLNQQIPAEHGEPLSIKLAEAAQQSLERSFDHHHGGFGGAPKFPHAMDLQLLLRLWYRRPRELTLEMVRTTLDRMAAGGIYDHLGGGFARYSVDERWLVPHFEKMLYDNALLAATYVEAHLATGHGHYAQIARETIDYVLRDMTDSAGGFYSSEDADSEGEEGKFYVWTPAELVDVLGADAARTFASVYDVTDEGNFEGKNILNLRSSVDASAKILGRDAGELAHELAQSRQVLLAARNRRVRPGRDEKVLVSWNCLMIDALARAAGALEEPRYSAAADKAARFILENLVRPDGRLLHVWCRGQAKLAAYLDDYACLVQSLVSLYEHDHDERWIDQAALFADQMIEHFADPEQGGFYYTASDHEKLIARMKDFADSSVPSGSAMAATSLLRLGKLCGSTRYIDAGVSALQSASAILRDFPTSAGQMLLALDFYLGPTCEIVLVSADHSHDFEAVLADLSRHYIPHKVVAARVLDMAPEPPRSARLEALFRGKQAEQVSPTAYLCQDFACREPVSGRDAILGLWKDLASPEQISRRLATPGGDGP
jgi:uncharacterized protein YyaL (SSP411 family)